MAGAKAGIVASWKEKMLDYEIETVAQICPKLTQFLCWKEKMLDYEIETPFSSQDPQSACFRWKEKMLDYEIETTHPNLWVTSRLALKRKDARLRDWNGVSTFLQTIRTISLKRKDARLRDWNNSQICDRHFFNAICVEKKRCSITRLKQADSLNLPTDPADKLKRKDARLRDWNIEKIP